MESRVETLLNALVNGETIDFNPQSRMEEYLKNCINKSGTEGLPAPQSRVDALLYKLAEAVSSGGGGGEPTTPTDGRTSLAYWYEYLVDELGWSMYDDPETGNTFFAGEVLEELAYPVGTQNVTSARNFTKIYLQGEWVTVYDGVFVKKFTGTLDIPNVTNADSMFENCNDTEDIGCINFGPRITSCESMFSGCESLMHVPAFDTTNVLVMSSMFSACPALESLPEYDMREVFKATSMLYNCKSLVNVRLKNIKTNLQIGSGSTYGHLIVVDDLIFMIYHLRDTGSKKTFTIGSANLAKLADVYVKTIPITDEMRAEDDLIDEKLPFEVCASTDEGATLITDYVLGKNWTLK